MAISTIGTGEVVADLSTDRPPKQRRERGVLASVLLHGTLLVAVFIALFPVVWVLLSSLKPAYAIQSTEIELFNHPSLHNYKHELNPISGHAPLAAAARRRTAASACRRRGSRRVPCRSTRRPSTLRAAG